MSGAEVVLVGVLSVVVFLLLVLLTLQIWLAVRLRGERQIVRPRLPERGEELPDSQAPADELSFYGSVLRVEMGGDTGRLFRLRPKGSTWIGRDNSANDIVLASTSVSRRHSRIESDGTNFFVHDTGSTNGTFVNGQQVSTSLLRHGDTLTIGNVVFRFFAGPEAGLPSH